MRRMVALIFIVLVFGTLVEAAEIPSYHSYLDFLLASPGSMGYGLYGYANPAMARQTDFGDILFAWSDATAANPYANDLSGGTDLDRWGIFSGMFNGFLGFGAIHESNACVGDVTDYRISFSFGDRSKSFGIGYGWSTGDTDVYQRANLWTLGSVLRPVPYLSMGLWGSFATDGSNAGEGCADIGIRPFGNEKVTLFADYALQKDQRIKDGAWSTGAVFEPLPGLRITGRYFDTHRFTVGLSIGLGRLTASSQAHYDDNKHHAYTTYAVRLGGIDRSFIKKAFTRRKNYLELNLKGQVKYQRYRLFDKSNTLLDLLDAIDAAEEDPSITGIAINTGGMNINWELAWEIRQKLEEFKRSGKRVVIFLEDATLPTYHFASVADRIVLDPTGEIALLGMRFGKFYLKGTLEKLGLGFDEWRFFKYKSAYETFSREKMSEGDEEQLKAIIDDFYDLARSEICESRGFSPDEFDRLVNEGYFFTPDEALESGLVDTLGRWDEVKKTIEELEGGSKKMIKPSRLARYSQLHDDYWGEPPRIAVIYALGACAMESGIKARSLSKLIDRIADAKSIKAVVFRVDSPGGSAMASDIVAEALKKCSEKKPVIVSQGWVAGSGGYWISMYGDTIVAAPNTITGSIGVIGGWIYNKGLKERLGMSTDLVKVGEHADLGFGIPLPLLGTIPDRNLTSDERANVEHDIKSFYKKFVEKVAEGRHKSPDEIAKIAQGRVWSGIDGLSIGLVDEIGGIERAIEIAKAKAGIAPEIKVNLIQFPQPPLLNMNIFMPKLFGMKLKSDPALEYLHFRIEHNGEALPMIPLDVMDAIDDYEGPQM